MTVITKDTEYGTMVPYLQALHKPDNFSIVITGKSGAGKTSWAIKHCTKPSLLVTHMDDLKEYNPSKHKSIVFDDMSFHHIPITGQIHIVDYDLPRSIHARYGTAHIPAKTEKFFTCNEFPFSKCPAITRRIKFIEV